MPVSYRHPRTAERHYRPQSLDRNHRSNLYAARRSPIRSSTGRIFSPFHGRTISTVLAAGPRTVCHQASPSNAPCWFDIVSETGGPAPDCDSIGILDNVWCFRPCGQTVARLAGSLWVPAMVFRESPQQRKLRSLVTSRADRLLDFDYVTTSSPNLRKQICETRAPSGICDILAGMPRDGTDFIHPPITMCGCLCRPALERYHRSYPGRTHALATRPARHHLRNSGGAGSSIGVGRFV